MRRSLLFSIVSLASVSLPASADTFGSGVSQFLLEFVEISGGSDADQGRYGAASGCRMGKLEVSRSMIDTYNANAAAEGRPGMGR